MTLSRRTLLRGAGVAMALPWLEAMLPRTARAATMPAPPTRFLGYYVPNGIRMEHWTPATTGPGYALTPILKPLAPVKDKVLVLSGLSANPGKPDGAGDHASGIGAFLTATKVVKTEGANIKNGVSVDQLIAQKVGAQTKLPSLELGCVEPGSYPGCDSGYSCAYSHNIAWATPTTPLPKEIDPKAAFNRLFAGFNPGEGLAAATLERRRLLKLSVLDAVLDDSKKLHAKLGVTDRQKLEAYQNGIWELEKKLEGAGQAPTGPVCDPGKAPPSWSTITQYVEQMMDVIALAFRCDMTRAATFMMSNGLGGRVHTWLGINDVHHYLSHHGNDPQKLDKLTKINAWEVEMLAWLLTRLDAMPEGDGTVLDNTLVYFSSEVSDGNLHNHVNMPVLVAGGTKVFQSGRHVKLDGNPPVANLFTTILNACGVPNAKFGDDGTGALALG
ncbi:MAG: hypothetical protein AMXMBFR64_02430 [Myxococcales bacterium]